MNTNTTQKMTNYRWVICGMLFLATTINYLDRQVLSLTWKDFIAPDFHWTDTDYGNIAAVFALVYAIANLFSGRFMDWIGVKRGYLWAIGIWSLGACMHAGCGLATMWQLNLGSTQEMLQATGDVALAISTVSTYCFMISRFVLGVGESGNFPAAIKVTAEYFPMKDRAFATSIFNSGSTIGALIAPLSIPLLARYFKNIGWGNGWEMAFIIIGALGFIWLGLWMFIYKKPEDCKRVNAAELAYIQQDSCQHLREKESLSHQGEGEGEPEEAIPFIKFLTFPQTWGIFLAKLITDGVWWFFLFWTPAYISDVYGLKSDNPTAILLIFVLYAITMLSIYGGKLPTIIVNHTGLHAYDARLRAMFIFAVIPLLTLFAQPLGNYSYWFPIILIGLAGAAHQSWSANLFSVASDLFPKNAVGTMTGINGLAGGIGSYCINKYSGQLFDYADKTQLSYLGFEGKPAGYFIVFCYCAVAYLLGWLVLKALVPKYKAVR
ncbi:MAG: MFS transporter [Bacteroidaceae bacterium]|nr:MFS transporter [Bacteroidaceae bacterium]